MGGALNTGGGREKVSLRGDWKGGCDLAVGGVKRRLRSNCGR